MTETKKTILEFEKVLKESSVINISKVKEKDGKNWKLIYDIEGMVFNNFYFPYIKFIFYFNSELSEFASNELLIGDGVNYSVYSLNDLDDIFTKLNKVKTFQIFSNFVIDAVTEINKLTDEPIISFEQTMDENGVMPMNIKVLFFTVSTVNSQLNLSIRSNMSEIEIDGKKTILNNITDAYKIIAEKLK